MQESTTHDQALASELTDDDLAASNGACHDVRPDLSRDGHLARY